MIEIGFTSTLFHFLFSFSFDFNYDVFGEFEMKNNSI